MSASPERARPSSSRPLCARPKRLLTPVVNRTLHTYHSVLRIMCQAFAIETDGRDFKCEKRLIEEAHKQNKRGKMLAPIIDDAHLLKVEALRRLRLVFEDFPPTKERGTTSSSSANHSCSTPCLSPSTRTFAAASPTPPSSPSSPPTTCAAGSSASSTASPRTQRLHPRGPRPHRPLG